MNLLFWLLYTFSYQDLNAFTPIFPYRELLLNAYLLSDGLGSVRQVLNESVWVYNFTVAGVHTYFVFEVGVLVHNCGGIIWDNFAWRNADGQIVDPDDFIPSGYPGEEFLERLEIAKRTGKYQCYFCAKDQTTANSGFQGKNSNKNFWPFRWQAEPAR